MPTAASRRGLALAALCAVLFLTFLDATIVSVALADIQESLRAGVSSLQWIVNGYLLAFTGLMLTGGALGDLLGRKRVMLVGIVVFCAGSLVGALAHSTGTLIAGRVVMGVGAAACEPGTLSLIRQIYPDRRERARALGIWTAVSGISLALGPVLGGLLVAAGGWRNIFWFNVAFGLAMLGAAAATLPESADREGRRLDLPGLVAGAGAVTAVTFAVIEGENVGYGTWWIAVLFAVAAVAAGAFVRIERSARDPVVPLPLFRRPGFSGATAVGFGTSFGLFAVFLFTALYLQVVAKFSGGKIALQFLAMSVAMALGGWIAGRWTAARGPRGPMTLGCLLGGGAIFAVDAVLAPDVAFVPLAAALAAVGLGLGLALVAVTAAVLATVPPERSGVGASTLNTGRQFGGVLAVAILGAVVHAEIISDLERRLTALKAPELFKAAAVDFVTHGGIPADVAGAVAANPLAASFAPLLQPALTAAKAAFGQGLHAVFLVAAGVMLGAAVVALFSAERTPTVS